MKNNFSVPKFIIDEFNKVNQEKHFGNHPNDREQTNRQIEETLMKLDNMNLSVSNTLIFGAQPYSTILEAKLLRIVLSQIYSGENDMLPDQVNLTYTVRVKDLYHKLMPGNKSAKKSIYDTVKKTVIGLQSRILFIKDQNNGQWRSINWTAETSYANGKISITLNEKLLPYIQNLTGNFSIIPLDTLISFKNKYAMRIYESLYAKIYRDSKTRNHFLSGRVVSISFNIDEFKVISSTVGMYTGISMLKSKCINPAIKEITQKTDLSIDHVEYLSVAQRATDTIKFYISQKEDDKISEKEEQLVRLKHLFDDHVPLSKSYIVNILHGFGLSCDVDLDNLIYCYHFNNENSEDFNRDFQVAYKNAKSSALKYMQTMVKERQKVVNFSNETLQVNFFASTYGDDIVETTNRKTAEFVDWEDVTERENHTVKMRRQKMTNDWDTEELKQKFECVVDYWIQKKIESEAFIPDEYIHETKTLKAIKRTDIRHRRYFYELLKEGETVESIQEAIDVAAVSAWFLRVSGNFCYFINPKNYFDIASGDRDYDTEQANLWNMGR